jgi:hypothetical protein
MRPIWPVYEFMDQYTTLHALTRISIEKSVC